MPSKGSKAASRQAKLSQKRRRGKGAPRVYDSAPTAPREGVAGPVEAQSATEFEATAESQETASQTKRAVSEAASPSPRRRSRAAMAATAATAESTYPFLGIELRRIGLITFLIVVLLSVLTAVLSS